MTIELVEFKCPTCGHLLGEEEYIHACSEVRKVIQAEVEENREEMRRQDEWHKLELQEKDKKHELELQEKDKKHNYELTTKVNQQVQLQIDKKLNEQKEQYELKLSQSEAEKNAIKLQVANDIDSKIAEALEKQQEKYRQEKQYDQLKWERIQKRNEELQKTLDNIPSEFKGQAGELMLFDELQKAFPQDHLIAKTNGFEMPDIIQSIVTGKSDKICTQILWDMKTGETVTAKDIEKAKKYKEKYNTDYCIVVSAKGITTKDSKIYKTGLIGEREGVLIIHPKIVIAVAQLTRNFIIEKAKLIKNNNGKVSKQTKLYEYITSSARFRKMQEKMVKKIKLDNLQKLEEAYITKLWMEAKKLRQDWYDLDRDDQDNINAIVQEEECNNNQETDADQTKRDNEKKEE